MNCAMVMPHLILARTGTEDDASNGKTISRRLDQWINLDIGSVFLEAELNQERKSKTKTKGSVDDYSAIGKTCEEKKIPMPSEVLQKKRRMVSFP